MGQEAQEAEFVVRLALQGMTYIMQISGQGATHIAAMLQAIKNQPDNSPGVKRLATMLKSREPLRVFTITEANLQEFAQEAKRYGCQYCIAERTGENVALGTYDLLVKDIDAVRINHIIDKLNLATIDGRVDTNLSEEQFNGAVELTNAQRLMQELFSPNKEERIAEERENTGVMELEDLNRSEGSYKSTDSRSSIKQQLLENQLEIESTRDMFSVARELRVNMMSEGQNIDVEESYLKGWEEPKEEYNNLGEKLYRGKLSREMTPIDQVQYLVDQEMKNQGKLSEDTIGRIFQAGYKVDENGLVERLDTNFTNRERKLIVEMMREPGEVIKDFNEIKEAYSNG